MRVELLQKLAENTPLTSGELAELFPDSLPYLASVGRLDVLKRMHDELPDGPDMGRLKLAYKAFDAACESGQADVVNYFFTTLSTPRTLLWNRYIHSARVFSEDNDEKPMRRAAASGNLDTVKAIVEGYRLAIEEDPQYRFTGMLLGALDGKAMVDAAKRGHGDVLEYMLQEYAVEYKKERHSRRRLPPAPDGLAEAIVKQDDVACYRQIKPYLDSFERENVTREAIMKNKPNIGMYQLRRAIKNEIRHHIYGAYFSVESFGHAGFINRLLDVLPDGADEKLIAGYDERSGTYPPYQSACKHGHQKLFDKVLTFVSPEKREEMFLSLDDHKVSGLERATNNEKIQFIPYLLEKAGEHAPAMIRQNDYRPIKIGVEKGLIDTVKLYIDKLPEAERPVALQHVPERWQKVLADEPKRHLLWQEIGGGKARWQAVNRGNNPPPGVDARFTSPYGFSQKTYDELLPIMKAAARVEDSGEVELRTYKLAVLFSNKGEALRYLDNYVTAHPDAESPVHDACLFDLPVQGVWNITRWKDLVLKYGDDVTEYLQHAAKVDRTVQQQNLTFPDSPRKLLEMVSSFMYERAHERPDLAKVAAAYKVSEDRFDMALDFLLANTKTTDNLPPIFIDGTDLLAADKNLPANIVNYYMVKLDASDPLGLFLGDATNCCQSIGKEGDPFTRHGASSPDGGFYVWKKKTDGEITPADNVVAESWAWISQSNAVTFDSFERLSISYNFLCQPFLDAFEAIATKPAPDGPGHSRVTIGKGGETPSDLPYPDAEPPERPKDFKYLKTMEAQYDSKTQFWVTRTATRDNSKLEK